MGRDPDVVARGVESWLAARSGSPATVTSVTQPSAGYSSDTNLVEVVQVADGIERQRSLVIRMAPPGPGTFPAFDLAAQAAAQRVAAHAGVPVAAPLVVEPDPSWLGAPFLVMPRVDGHIVGDAPGHDPWVCSLAEPDQTRLHEALVDTLAAIHAADAAGAVEAGVRRRDDAAELAAWAAYLDWSSNGDPLPVLVDALDHCRATAPRAEAEPVLLWGDVRLGNVVVGDDLAPRAVLDWDMTSVGSREHDVAWLTSLETTMRRLLGTRAPGLLDGPALAARYEAASGHRLHDLRWYETFALLRSAAVMTRLGYLARAAGEAPTFPIEDNPVLDLLRERI